MILELRGICLGWEKPKRSEPDFVVANAGKRELTDMLDRLGLRVPDAEPEDIGFSEPDPRP